MHRRRWAPVLTAALAVLLSTFSGAAQQVEPDCDTQLEGQWVGPYRLQSQINPPGKGHFREIAHAVVLPPPNAGWVLIWCARYCEDAPWTDNRTWVLHQSDPGTLIEIPVPDVTPLGSADLFCGGQTIDADGRVIVFGGTDLASGCPGSLAFGHDKVWVYDNVKIDPTGSPPTMPQWHLQPVPMAQPRWYAAAHRLARKPGETVDTIVVTGHVGQPNPGPIATDRVRQYGHFDSAFGVFVWDSPGLRNLRYESGQVPPADCSPAVVTEVKVRAYAHLHQLIDGRVQCIVTRDPAGPVAEPTVYLDRLICPTDPTDQERWIVDASQPLTPNPEGAPSVHLIDASLPAPPFAKEWIYSIGGGNGETGCADPVRNPKQVLMMEDPDETKDWVAAPSLKKDRNSSNASVGLDGSIIVNGGVGNCADDCPIQRRAERYRPPGIFFVPDTAWSLMCFQAHQRSYHSWSLTLPDATVLSGGGEDLCPEPDKCSGGCVPPDAPGNHTVEVFRPPYVYLGARPQITMVDGLDGWDNVPVKSHGQALEIQAVVPGNTGGEFRVALISPGAVTHALNTSQRYIKLGLHPQWNPVLNPPPAATTIDVLIPNDADIAPPGYYMVAITASNGSTSTAKWVKIEYAQ